MELATAAKEDTSCSSSKLPTYRLFGLTLASDFAFTTRLAAGTGAPDLTFLSTPEAPLPCGWKEMAPTYASTVQTDDGKSVLYLYRQTTYDVLHFTGVADFYLWPDRIVCELLDSEYAHMLEIHLLGKVLSLWLELQGIPALHASAVVVERHAVAFLATNTGGKSSLAATFMQAGYPLLADDILPIGEDHDAYFGRPGYPQMRMWPELAQLFLSDYQNLERAHPALAKRRILVGPDGLGSFCDNSQPLVCLYLPERRDPAVEDSAIEFIPVSPRDAVIELVRYSFAAYLLEKMDLRALRLHFLARLARQVPMRRILYPDGLEHLPRVRRAILADLACLQMRG